MPNWAETEMTVTLPIQKKESFLELIIDYNNLEHKEKQRYLAQTFLQDYSIADENENNVTLFITCKALWQLSS